MAMFIPYLVYAIILISVVTLTQIVYLGEDKTDVQDVQDVDPQPHACGLRNELDHWQTVMYAVSYVYSAHLDPDSKNNISHIQILGSLAEYVYLSEGNEKRFTCEVYIWSEDGVEIHSGELTSIKHRCKVMPVTAVQYHCYVNVHQDKLTNSTVTLSYAYESNVTETPPCLQVRQYYRQPLTYNFSVCIENVMRGFVDPTWFVEWMELHMILGAQKFVFHNLTIQHTLKKYIDHYVKLGVMDILPWHFPPGLDPDDTNMLVYLQHTAQTDCFMRLRQYSKYTVHIDLDEVIFPRHPDDRTWADMIQRADCEPDTPAYGAKQLLYCRQFNGNGRKTDLMTQDVVRRSKGVLRYGIRSKYIANTFECEDAEVHAATGKKGRKDCIMDIEVGASHHYRMYPVYTADPNFVTDSQVWKYNETLFRRVLAVVNV